MHIIFIHGPAASGKHTIGSLLSQTIDIPLFHNHLAVDPAKTLFDFGSPAFTNLRAAIWRAAFAEAANAQQSFIFTFHPEATVDPQLIQALVQIIESAGGQVYFVELRCSRAGILQRLGNESRGKFGKLMDSQLYAEIERQGGFDFPPLPEALITIDTERLSPTQAASAIAEALAAVAI